MNNILSDTETKLVQDILVAQLGVEAGQLVPDARIQEDLGADSLDVMEIILAAEDRFHLAIPDEEAEKVSTVGELMETLAKLLQHPQQALS